MSVPTSSRSRWATAGDPALRLRVAHLLGTARLEPEGMPAAAVLVVRRLADPLPRGLASGADAVVASAAWERTARAALGGCWSRAACPALGPVPPGADAVRFDDPAELLACLARDLAAGVAAGRWWWAAWLRAAPTAAGEALAALLCAEARHVPAALEMLAAAREAAPVLAALSPAQALRVFRAVDAAFDVPGLAAPPPVPSAAAEWPERTSPAPSSPRVEAGGWGEDVPRGEPEVEPPPWRAHLPGGAVPAGLSVERQALLGVALLLRRAPMVARSGAFHRAFLAWKAAALVDAARPTPRADAISAPEPAPPRLRDDAPLPVESAVVPGEHAARGGDGRPDRSLVPPAERVADDPAAAVTSVPPPSTAMRAPVTGETGTEAARASAFGPPVVPSSPTRTAAAERNAPAARADPPSAPQEDGARLVTAGAAAPAPRAPEPGAGPAIERMPGAEAGPAPPDPWADGGVVGAVTELAGVFFLVNALRHLRLWDHLDARFGVESPLGVWGWVELVARALLGRRRPEEEGDAVWRVLATLDGRAAEAPPPLAFRGAARYRLPDDWLAAASDVGDAPPWLVRTRGRLRLWHPAGFAVADARVAAPRSAAGAADAAAWLGDERARPAPAEVARRAARLCACRPLGLSSPAPLRRFLELVVPFLRWRLAGAMGIDPGRVADLLLRRRGRVAATRAHVDVHLPLAEARIAVRMAGLDADPGWVPALGRAVAFHFDP